ncbi:MAG: 30S ribosomal protein S20 [Chloroflexi bacterium]|nr:30S ribosomal protein S20 [Chloroflexota bacterium]
MANTKSAEKRWRQSLKRRLRNRVVAGSARTFVRDTVRAIRGGNADEDKLKLAVRALDKAAEKGVIHKNNAARRKSRLMKQFAVVAAGGTLEPVQRQASRQRRAGVTRASVKAGRRR